MSKIIKWILCAFVGCFASFVLMLINDTLHILITSGIVAFCVASIIEQFVKSKNFKRVLAVVGFIIVFLIYLLLMNNVDDENLNIWWILLYWGPYAFCSYLFFKE